MTFLDPYTVVCPACGEATPTVLLCEHDADPLCITCCEARHERQCPGCFGHGATTKPRPDGRGVVTDRHGYAVVVTCPTCGGRGRINERTAS